MVDPKETTVSQTHELPMTELDAVKDHAAAVRALVSWDRVGVLMDEGPHAVVTVLLKGDAVVSAARFCLSAAESVDALRAYNEMSAVPMELRCWQGHAMTGKHTRDLAELTTVWRESSGQGKEQAEEDWRAFFEEIETNTLRRGRGAGISVPTRNQVLLDAHGRCMFEGCGADLTEDPVTHVRGNFATLAHNVAAAAGGTRGVLYLSGSLADDPRTSCCSATHTTGWWIRSPRPTIRQPRCRRCGGVSARRGPPCSTPWPSRRCLHSAWRGPCTGKGSHCHRRSRSDGR